MVMSTTTTMYVAYLTCLILLLPTLSQVSANSEGQLLNYIN